MNRMKLMACCYNDPEMLIDLDTVYPIRADCRNDVPKTRFKPKPRRTLSPRRWKLLLAEEGLDVAGMIQRVQRGGVHPTIKGEVWVFLLGCYDPKSSTQQRNQLRQQRRLEYEKLKTKCREMDASIGSGSVVTMPVITEDGHPTDVPNSNGGARLSVVDAEQQTNDASLPNGGARLSSADAEQQTDDASLPDGGARTSSTDAEQQTNDPQLPKEVVQWKLTLHQIGLDVNRTDGTLVYYESQENLARLWDILAVYSWVDKDIGYCQGMSDLCSPISIILEHEADAFWCFERLMRRVRANFKSTSTSIGVRSQLTTLASIMKAVDPKLHQHLENLDGGEYLFAFRMLMVLFRREFSFVDSMYLWELMWSMEYNPGLFSMLESNTGTSDKNDEDTLKQCGKYERKKLQAAKKDEQIPLSVFLVASILEAKNKRLLGEAKGLDDVVKILNEITGSVDAKKACRGALTIHKKYLTTVKAS